MKFLHIVIFEQKDGNIVLEEVEAISREAARQAINKKHKGVKILKTERVTPIESEENKEGEK